MVFITCLCDFLAASAHAWAEVCHHTAAEVCHRQPLIYGQLTRALAILAVIAEESLTQASFQTLSQPSSLDGWQSQLSLSKDQDRGTHRSRHSKSMDLWIPPVFRQGELALSSIQRRVDSVFERTLGPVILQPILSVYSLVPRPFCV